MIGRPLANGILSWWLGLEEIDLAEKGLEVGWAHPLPLWGWAAVGLAAAAVGWTSYRRLLGHRAGRAVLGGVRAVVVGLLAVLLAGPLLIDPEQRIEPDHVLTLVDRSASMTVRDVQASGSDGSSSESDSSGDRWRSRDEQLKAMLRSHERLWSRLAPADGHRELHWLGFGERLQELAGPTSLGPADDRLTALPSALGNSLRRLAGKPISAVVLFSDGRSSRSLGPETWNRLRREGVPVFPVPLGAKDPPPDLAIQRVEAPDRAFVDDTVPVTVGLRTNEGTRDGGSSDDAKKKVSDASVQLVDTATDKVLDKAKVGRVDRPVRLLTTPEAAGKAEWVVRLESDRPDLIERNNRRSFTVDLVDRPIRVLYVEGYPRWEYRYLKNMLVRESSITSSVLLLSADPKFAQEGNKPLERLPRSAEELKPYDVILLGDVRAGYFTKKQLRLIKQHVSTRGGGLIWIAGPRRTPQSYLGGPLADLLPMHGSQSTDRLASPVDLQPTAAARALGVLRLGRPGKGGEKPGWPKDLPKLLWGQAVGPLKPATEPLAADRETGAPIVMRMRYGAGDTLFVATDEIWRWRHGRGPLYFEQFWMQLIRLLGRSRLEAKAGEGQRATVRVSHRRASVGDTLVVKVKLLDQSLLEGGSEGSVGEGVNVSVRPKASGDGSGPRAAASQRLLLTPTDEKGVYRGEWTPSRAGTLVLRVDDKRLGKVEAKRTVEVVRRAHELLHPQANHELLKTLAEKTNGKVLGPDSLSKLPKLVPDRQRPTPADTQESLASTPLALAVLLLLLTGEWIGRKLLGLA